METYLTVDIGNTAVSLAVMRGLRAKDTVSVAVNQPSRKFEAELSNSLKSLRCGHQGVSAAVVCSVVPAKTAPVCKLIRKGWNLKPLRIGKELTVPLVNKYRNPDQVGRDRLVGAYATQRLYGQPAIVIDFGTAITFDVLSDQGHYAGGIIVPGMRLSLESLHAKTAMLPRVEDVRRPKTVIGRTTEESILSGLVYGYGEMCRGLIDRIRADLQGAPRIVVTGGYARLMVRFLADFSPVVDPCLVHKGLVLCRQGPDGALPPSARKP